jgi:hypothetical protein
MRGLLATALFTIAALASAAAAQPYGQGYGQGYGGPGYGDGRWRDRDDWNGRRDWNGGNWETIGQKTVDSRYDRDHLRVRGSERYRKIRLCSLDRPIQLNGMSVEFHNGERQNFPVSMVIRRGDCTPSFDLDGRRRNMDDIWFNFVKLRRGSEPRVIIQAR